MTERGYAFVSIYIVSFLRSFGLLDIQDAFPFSECKRLSTYKRTEDTHTRTHTHTHMQEPPQPQQERARGGDRGNYRRVLFFMFATTSLLAWWMDSIRDEVADASEKWGTEDSLELHIDGYGHTEHDDEHVHDHHHDHHHADHHHHDDDHYEGGHAFGSCPFDHDHHEHDHDHDHEHGSLEEWEVTVDTTGDEGMDGEELFRRSELSGGKSGLNSASSSATVFPSIVRSRPTGILKFTPTSYPYYALVPEKVFRDLEFEAAANAKSNSPEILHPTPSLLQVASHRSPLVSVIFWYRRPFCGAYCEDAMRLYVDAVSSLRAAVHALAGDYPVESIAYHTPKELVRVFDSAVQFAVVGVRTDSSLDANVRDAAEVERLKTQYSKFISDKGPHYLPIDDYPTITVVSGKSLDAFADLFTPYASATSSASTSEPRLGTAPEGYNGELTAKGLWFGVVEPQLRRLLEPKCFPTQPEAINIEVGEGGEGPVVLGEGLGYEGEDAPLGEDELGASPPPPPQRSPIRPVRGVETNPSADEVFVGEAGLMDLCVLLYPQTPADEPIAVGEPEGAVFQEGESEGSTVPAPSEGDAPWFMTQRRMLDLFEEATLAANTETARLRHNEALEREKEIAEVLEKMKPKAATAASGLVRPSKVSAVARDEHLLRPKEFTFMNGTLSWSVEA